ncbi:hypothetical protein [endosymbiont GvMRE of Glomus versiforme]|uniref:hypothetical protein n=1 Tax=endosymbiont GvMRE of Glomus versiforme TaxID=2039283 RepID=UPI000ED96D39|nr:hypothetical protein [endosymbiont GvMRE of Glomus versiforme]RHZ37747.1 hypothetical protein GvMRE_I1g530 [endosymbiont GvMRE of Glomus versiforme]
MLIYATCKCCTEKNKIVKNYDIEGIFKQNPEFKARLLNSLLEHLRELEKVCQSQGHYNKIWIKPDEFMKETTKLPTEILEEFLPEDKKKKFSDTSRTETKHHEDYLDIYFQLDKDETEANETDNLILHVGKTLDDTFHKLGEAWKSDGNWINVYDEKDDPVVPDKYKGKELVKVIFSGLTPDQKTEIINKINSPSIYGYIICHIKGKASYDKETRGLIFKAEGLIFEIDILTPL